jgi:hypothetical protein
MEIFPTMIDYETFLSAIQYNQSPLEQTNFISSTGQLPSADDLNQTSKSAANYASAGDYYIDSGIADSYILLPFTTTGINFFGITQYFTGARFRFKPLHNNTGACSASINGLSPKLIKLKSGSDPVAGDLSNTEFYELTYDGTNLILDNPSISSGKSVSNYVAGADYYNETGAANAYVLTHLTSPLNFEPITQYFTGCRVRFTPTHANTGASTVNVNGLGVKSIKLPSLGDPKAGDIPAITQTELVYDGTYFILQNPSTTDRIVIADYSSSGDFYIDSGTADDYILSPKDGYEGISAYIEGCRVRFIPGNDNTGACTINVNGHGPVNVKLNGGSDPKAGDIPSGIETTVVYTGSVFIIENPPVTDNINVSNYSSAGDFYVDSGTTNTYILSASSGFEPMSSYFIGGRVRFLPLASNTGASTVNVNGLGTKSIKLANTADPTALDILRGSECILYYDGANFVLVNPLGSSQSPYPTGYQYKAKIASNEADPDNYVDFDPGNVRDQNDLYNIVLTDFITKNISRNWEPGSGNGGMAGDYDVNTCYGCFLIADGEGNVDAGFDDNFNAGNLLAASGYTFYRRRGFVLTDSAARVRRFYVTGNDFWLEKFTDTIVTAPNSSTPALMATVSPPKEMLVYLFHSIITGSGLNTAAILSPLSEQPTINTASYYTAYTTVPDGDEDMISARLSVVTNDVPQVYLKANTADGSESLIYTMGWHDPLED